MIIYAPSLVRLCPNWSIFPSWLNQHYILIHVRNESTDHADQIIGWIFCFWRYWRIGVWYSLKKACDNPSFVQSLCRIVRRYGLINIQKWQSMFCVLVQDVLHNVFFRSVQSFVITRSLNPILFPVNFSVREETIKSRKVWFFSLLCFPVLEKCDLTLSLDVRYDRSSPLFKKERRKIAISVIYPWLWDCHFPLKETTWPVILHETLWD